MRRRNNAARRQLLTDEERLALLGIPPDAHSLARLFTLSRADRSLVAERRGDANRLGCAVQVALVRHPGTALAYLDQPPDALVSWMPSQLEIPTAAFAEYARRPQTMTDHARQIAATLRLRPPTIADLPPMIEAAADAARGTDDGQPIAAAVVAALRAARIILPGAAVIERIAWLAGRASELDRRLKRFSRRLPRSELKGVELRDGRLHVAPVKATATLEARACADRIAAMTPSARITELLHEVNRVTGFASAFTNLRTGERCDDVNALLAAILADATNLGLGRMAAASHGVSRDKLIWTADAYIRPVQELGRVERTLFMLDWLESSDLRQRCQAGLNKSEQRHALAQVICTFKQGRIADRGHEAQQFRAAGLNLVIAAIVYWNSTYLADAVQHLRDQGKPAPDVLLVHTSPLT